MHSYSALERHDILSAIVYSYGTFYTKGGSFASNRHTIERRCSCVADGVRPFSHVNRLGLPDKNVDLH